MNPLAKKCHVCGDKATGFKYNGLSCLSCKVFFHRNSFRLSELYCDRAGKCVINMLNRKDCTKCRLEKCFLVGMKRKCEETISNAERAIELGIVQCLGIRKTNATKLIQYPSSIPKNRSLKQFNSYEHERIFEAKTANCVFPDELNCQIVAIVRTKEELYQLGEFSDFYIRKSVNFCQNFAAFNNLSQDDQMQLLKSFIFDILGIRFAFIANLEGKFMPMILDDAGTKVVAFHEDIHKEYNNQEIFESSQKLLIEFQLEMENDIIIRDLLSAMCLFRSHENVSCPELVRYHYFLYTQLLVRYLERKYQNKKVARKKYHKLMNLINEMQMFKVLKHEIIGEFGPSKFPNIILELYDLM